MHKKAGLWAILAAFFIFAVMDSDSAFAANAPDIVGEAAILINNTNGQVLYEKNAHQRMYPASTTKTLTAIIALENSTLSEKVTISKEACNVEGSAIGLQEGETIPMEDLLYALMLSSGNDAAIAIAQHIGGSVEHFVDLMNQKAAHLGATNSHFNNPNGLPDAEHYSTAYDLALISNYAMQNLEFRKIVSTEDNKIQRDHPEAQTNLSNHNKLLRRYEGAIGIKTGYTTAAGQCLIAAAKRDNRELIAVVLASVGTGIWDDTGILLDYGFDEFKSASIIDTAQYVLDASVKHGESDTVPIITSRSFTYDFPRDMAQELKQEIVLNEPISAPIQANTKLGELVFFSAEQEIGRVDLISQLEVEEKRWFSGWWSWLIPIVLLLFVLRALSKTRRYKSRRRRRYINRNGRVYY